MYFLSSSAIRCSGFSFVLKASDSARLSPHSLQFAFLSWFNHLLLFSARGGGGGMRKARSADGAPTTTNPWLNIISFMHHPYLHRVPRLFRLLQLWLTLGNSRKMTVSNSICAPPLAGHLQLIVIINRQLGHRAD